MSQSVVTNCCSGGHHNEGGGDASSQPSRLPSPSLLNTDNADCYRGRINEGSCDAISQPSPILNSTLHAHTHNADSYGGRMEDGGDTGSIWSSTLPSPLYVHTENMIGSKGEQMNDSVASSPPFAVPSPLHAHTENMSGSKGEQMMNSDASSQPSTLLSQPPPPKDNKDLGIEDTDNGLEYNTLHSRINLHGPMYEMKVCALLFLRGLRHTAGFVLATNVDELGKFDDVLFKFRPKQHPEQEKTCFLQLKHKQNELKSSSLTREPLKKENYFELKNYYFSYCQVKKMMNRESKSKLFNGSFDNCEFVFYTNMSPHDELVKSHDHDHVSLDFRIISSGKENELIFNISRDKDADLYHEVEETVKSISIKQLSVEDRAPVEEYLSKITVLCGQASEHEMDILIEREMQFLLQADLADTKLFMEKIKNWWEDPKRALTENATLWQEVATSSLNSKIEENILNMVVNYSAQTIDAFRLELFASRVVVVTGVEIELSSLKVFRALKLSDSTGFIFMELEEVLKRQREMLHIWQAAWCDILVIECSTDITACRLIELAVELNRIARIKNLILIVRPGHKFYGLIHNYKEVQDCFAFSQLDELSQDVVLKKKVNFQGMTTSLASVVGEYTEEITGDMICQLLLQEKEFNICPDPTIELPYYITRSLQHCTCVRTDVLKISKSEYFIVSNISEQELQHLVLPGERLTKYSRSLSQITCRFIAADDTFSEHNFHHLSRSNDDKSIQWLRFNQNLLWWKKSSKDITIIRQNLDEKRICEYSDIQNERIALLTAEPGMGKSTLLCHLAKTMHQGPHPPWKISLNLNDITNLFEDKEKEYFQDEENVITFLSSAAKFENSSFEKRIFEKMFKLSGNVAIFLDGFDEITPDYNDVVISLINCVLKTKMKQLVVTSRVAMRKTLEEDLCLISYTLHPFTIENQCSFLMKYWKSTIQIASDERLQTFARSLLDLISQSLNDKDKHITGIPLQIFMLAEAFKSSMHHFILTGINNLPKTLDLLNLFENFIKQKRAIYYKEKLEWDTTKPCLRREIKKSEGKFESNHMNAALLLLLSEKQLRSLDTFRPSETVDFLNEIAHGHEKIGIIDGIINDRPRFIHRTFSEYFLALWFSKNIKSPNIKDFLASYLFNENNQTTRYFYDYILTKDCPLHRAVLSGERKLLQSLIASSRTDIDMRDRAYRTALHLAASYPNITQIAEMSIIELLLTHNANVNSRDEVFQWTPLQYAQWTELWGNVEQLLRYGARTEELNSRMLFMDNTMLLLSAAEQGYVKLLEFYLDNGVSVNTVVKSSNKFTLLHVAAGAGNVESVKFLVGRGADIMSRGKYLSTPLHEAAKKGCLEGVQYLVNAKCDVNVRDNEARTPLHKAAEEGRLNVMQWLVDAGSEVNAKDKYEQTLLHCSSVGDHLDVVHFLIENTGADVNAKDNRGMSPLHGACRCGRLSVVQRLVHANVKVNATDNEAQVPLHKAAVAGHLDVCQYLVKFGADVNARDKDGLNPLHWAARWGQIEVVEWFVEKEFGINAVDNHGNTILLWAARGGHLNVTQFLVTNVGAVNTVDKEHLSPLHWAARRGHISLVEWLVTYAEADVNARDHHNKTPLHWAALNGEVRVCQCLVEAGADANATDDEMQTSLHHAGTAWRGHINVVQWLVVKAGADVNFRDKNNHTPLHRASKEGRLNIVQWLTKEGGADVNAVDCNKQNSLHIAAKNGKLNVVQWLIKEGGVDVNDVDCNKQNSLHIAAKNGRLNVVQWLTKEGGADVNSVDSNKQNSLHIAAKNGRLNVVQWLVMEAGADVNEKDNNGFTPLTLTIHKFGDASDTALWLENKFTHSNIPK